MEVYKITNNITGQFYIGKNEKSDPNYYGSGVKIKESINKYGLDNHTKQVIAIISSTSPNPKKDLLLIEGVLIREYIEDTNCLNISRGKSVKGKEKCLHKSIKSSNYYKKLSEENKKLSEENKKLREENKDLKEENEFARANNNVNTLLKDNEYLSESLTYYIEKELYPNKSRLGRSLSAMLWYDTYKKYKQQS